MKLIHLPLMLGMLFVFISCSKEANSPDTTPDPLPDGAPVKLLSFSTYGTNGIDSAYEAYTYDDSMRIMTIDGSYYEKDINGVYQLTPMVTNFTRDENQRLIRIKTTKQNSLGSFSNFRYFAYESATSKRVMRATLVGFTTNSAPWMDSCAYLYKDGRLVKVTTYYWMNKAKFAYADSFVYAADGRPTDIYDINETTTPGVFRGIPVPLEFDGKPNPLYISDDAMAFSRNRQKWAPQNFTKFGLQSITYEYRADGRPVKMNAPNFTGIFRYNR